MLSSVFKPLKRMPLMSTIRSFAKISPAAQPARDTTELKNMLDGKLYLSSDPLLVDMRTECRRVLRKFNESAADEPEYRQKLLAELLGVGETDAYIEPPFYCDYGTNIKLGKNVYMNYGCTFLDVNEIEVGDNTMFAPHVSVYTATHPVEYDLRNQSQEYGFKIKIGKNCWIGGNVIIMPKVTIGDGSVIGAGAVVTKDVPPNSIVVGNPGRVLKTIKQ